MFGMVPDGSDRILIVDDEIGVRATLKPVLEKHGFFVRSVGSVPEALSEIRSGPFSGLICDLNLGPHENACVVIRAIRQANSRAVVIILTGYPELVSAVEAVRESVDDYVIKPSNADALVQVLRRKLSLRQSKARILSLSYDDVLLRTRNMLLEREGYKVVSASNLETGIAACESGPFDVFVLGHSIPIADKQEMVQAFRRRCPGVIISLRRGLGDELVVGADFHIDPDPEQLLSRIASIVKEKTSNPN
jgi:DNA-binding NtrC family response regulator